MSSDNDVNNDSDDDFSSNYQRLSPVTKIKVKLKQAVVQVTMLKYVHVVPVDHSCSTNNKRIATNAASKTNTDTLVWTSGTGPHLNTGFKQSNGFRNLLDKLSGDSRKV